MHNFVHTYQNHNPFFFPARQQKILKIRQLNMAIEVFRNFEISDDSNFEICNTNEHNIPWLQAMPLVEVTLNATLHYSTQMSPVYILYECLLHLPVDCLDGRLHIKAA